MTITAETLAQSVTDRLDEKYRFSAYSDRPTVGEALDALRLAVLSFGDNDEATVSATVNEAWLEICHNYLREPATHLVVRATGRAAHGWDIAVQVGSLRDYKTGDYIRPATAEERAASLEAAERDGGRGVIEVDGRPVYVED